MTPIGRRLALYTVTGRHPLHLTSTVAIRTPGTSVPAVAASQGLSLPLPAVPAGVPHLRLVTA